MRDLDFISGNFFDYDIPRGMQYLLKYFTTDLQVAFLKYALVFEDTKLFKDHTGHYCSDRLKFRLLCRLRQLKKLHEQAKTSFTEEGLNTLQLLESGQYPLTGDEFS
jgi:hypothetical protein